MIVFNQIGSIILGKEIMLKGLTPKQYDVLAIFLPKINYGLGVVNEYNNTHKSNGKQIKIQVLYPMLKLFAAEGLIIKCQPYDIVDSQLSKRQYYRITTKGASALIITEDLRKEKAEGVTSFALDFNRKQYAAA